MTFGIALLVFVATWPLAGLIAAGYANAYIQRKYPSVRSDSDRRTAILLCCACGWGALFDEIVCQAQRRGEYGWSLRRDAVRGWEKR